MKKLFGNVVLMLFVFMLIGCNAGDSGNNMESMKEQNTWMKERIAELEDENAALRSEVSELMPEFTEIFEDDTESATEEIIEEEIED